MKRNDCPTDRLQALIDALENEKQQLMNRGGFFDPQDHNDAIHYLKTGETE